MRTLSVTRLGAVMLAVAALLIGTAGTSAAITVQNPSFEDVAIACPPCLSSNPADVPGWTPTGAHGDALIWRVGYSDSGGSVTVAGEGQQFVTMGGGSGAAGNGHWTQIVGGFTPGVDYDLLFMMANELQNVSQSITVSFPSGSSTLAQTFSAATHTQANYWRVWEDKLVTFHATSAAVTIDFGASVQFDVGLDNIRINEVASSRVPEPTSLVLLAAGLAGLTAPRWRRLWRNLRDER